jgi:hypothetical protein
MKTEISLFDPDVFTGGDGFAMTLVTDVPSPNICREDTEQETDLLPLATLLRAAMFKAILSSTATNPGCIERWVSIWRLPKDAATNEPSQRGLERLKEAIFTDRTTHEMKAISEEKRCGEEERRR